MILIVHDALEVTIRIRLHINQINLASGVQSCAYHWLDVIRSAGKLLIQAADTEIDKLLAHSSAIYVFLSAVCPVILTWTSQTETNRSSELTQTGKDEMSR